MNKFVLTRENIEYAVVCLNIDGHEEQHPIMGYDLNELLVKSKGCCRIKDSRYLKAISADNTDFRYVYDKEKRDYCVFYKGKDSPLYASTAAKHILCILLESKCFGDVKMTSHELLERLEEEHNSMERNTMLGEIKSLRRELKNYTGEYTIRDNTDKTGYSITS